MKVLKFFFPVNELKQSGADHTRLSNIIEINSRNWGLVFLFSFFSFANELFAVAWLLDYVPTSQQIWIFANRVETRTRIPSVEWINKEQNGGSAYRFTRKIILPLFQAKPETNQILDEIGELNDAFIWFAAR